MTCYPGRGGLGEKFSWRSTLRIFSPPWVLPGVYAHQSCYLRRGDTRRRSPQWWGRRHGRRHFLYEDVLYENPRIPENPVLDGDSAVAIFVFASSVCHVWRGCGRRHDGEIILVFKAFEIILGPVSHATVLHGQINVQNQVRCLVC